MPPMPAPLPTFAPGDAGTAPPGVWAAPKNDPSTSMEPSSSNMNSVNMDSIKEAGEAENMAKEDLLHQKLIGETTAKPAPSEADTDKPDPAQQMQQQQRRKRNHNVRADKTDTTS